MLRLKSGFESPVDWTALNHLYLKNADQGYSWSDLSHYWQYVIPYDPNILETILSNEQAHSGSRSLKMYEKSRVSNSRIQLQIYANDTNPAANELSGPKLYVSRWLYIASSMAYGTDKWLAFFSTRELGPDPNLSVILNSVGDGGTNLIFRAECRRYTVPHTIYFMESNYDIPVPEGRWFHLETYVVRHETDGIFQVWVDGVQVFDLQYVKTKYAYDSYMMRPFMVCNCNMPLPLIVYADDLEIWDNLPTVAAHTLTVDSTPQGIPFDIRGV